MQIDGVVNEARCAQCGVGFAAFTFSGDTDMTTFGLAAASSGSRHLVLGALTPTELNARDRGEKAFAKRAGDALGRDCRPVHVKRYEGEVSSAGLTFTEFRAVYKPPQPIYRCPVCGGDGDVVARSSPAEFLRSGGEIYLVGDVALPNGD